MTRKRTKLYKIFLFSLLASIAPPLIFYFVFRTKQVQTFTIQKVISYVSETFDTKISLSGIDLGLFSGITLEKVFVEDYRKDTLFYVGKLKTSLDSISLKNNAIYLSNIELNSPKACFVADSSGKLNLFYFLDKFISSNTDTASTSGAFKLAFNRCEIKNAEFSMRSYNTVSIKNLINFDDLHVKNVNLIAENFLLTDTIKFNIVSLSLKEKSGLTIKQLSGKTQICNTGIFLDNLELYLDNSYISTPYYKMEYKKFGDIPDFLNKVTLSADFQKGSHVNLKDIAYFAEPLQSIDLDVRIKGKAKGKVSALRGKKFLLKFGKKTEIITDFSIDGLPNIDETLLFFDIKKMTTYKSDLEQIPLPPFEKGKKLVLPQQLSQLGRIQFKGNFTGLINDFVAYGTFKTNIGTLSSDIRLFPDKEKNLNFSGKLNFSEFDLGQLIQEKEILGKIDFDAKLEGKLLENSSFAIQLESNIKQVELIGYNYENIKISGNATNNKFAGEINIDDKFLELDFKGNVDLSKKRPVFDFVADIEKANLKTLKLDTYHKKSDLKLFVKADFEGNDIDNITGSVKIENSSFDNGEKIKIKYFSAKLSEEEEKKININSDFFEAKINGNFCFKTLVSSVENLAYQYLPVFSGSEKPILDTTLIEEKIHFNINLKNTEQLTKAFLPMLKIAKNTQVSGLFNSKNQELNMNLFSPKLQVEDKLFDFCFLNVNTNDRDLSLNLGCETFHLNKESRFGNVSISSDIINDSIQLNLDFNNWDTIKYSGTASALAVLSYKPKNLFDVSLFLDSTKIVFADSVWFIAPGSAYIDSSLQNIRIDSFKVQKNHLKNIPESQYIAVNGKISPQKEDKLFLQIKNFDLKNLNHFTKPAGIEVEGILNGTSQVSDLYKNPYILTLDSIQNLKLNGEKWGELKLLSNWNSETEKLDVNLFTKRGRIKTINLTGDYSPQKNQFNFNLDINKLKLELLQPFIAEHLTFYKGGRINAKIKLTGTPENPLVDGFLYLKNANFTVNYLKTKYLITDTIDITNNSIAIRKTNIFDQKGNKAELSGLISHNKFSDINFDIKLAIPEKRGFMFLNTVEKDNSLYFGTAYAKGLVNVVGNPSDIIIKIVAKTCKGTQFNIPLSAAAEVDENNFLTFVNYNDTIKESEKEKDYEVDLSGITLDFSLEATPDAEIKIIFDEKVGDVVKAQGYGNLKMDISTLGHLGMSGRYEIKKGSYLFTMKNLISKKFDIARGGSITWNGDPFNANLDLKAVYKLKKVSAKELTIGEEAGNQRIPVDCKIDMKGNLNNPTINFGVDFKPEHENLAASIKNLGEDEKNKQFLSLLITSSFQPLPGYIPTGESDLTVINTGEILANQLNHWLSNIKTFDLGVSYHSGGSASNDEVEVAFSKELWNERLTVNLNGNFGLSSSENQTKALGEQEKSTSQIAGEVEIEYKMTKNGKLRVKGFSRNNPKREYQSPYEHGVGIIYQEDFDTFKELRQKYWKNIKSLFTKNKEKKK